MTEQTSRTIDVAGWSTSRNDKAALSCKKSHKKIQYDSVYCTHTDQWVSTQQCRTCNHFEA